MTKELKDTVINVTTDMSSKDIDELTKYIADIRKEKRIEETNKEKEIILGLLGETNQLGREIYTQAEVAKVAGVTPATVRSIKKEADASKVMNDSKEDSNKENNNENESKDK